MHTEYVSIAAETLKNALQVKAGEEILVITDELTLPFGEAYRQAAAGLGHQVSLLVIPVTSTDGSEPPAVVGASMLAANVVIAVTKYSLTHCKAIKRARDAGVRFLTIPNISQSLFCSPAMVLSEEGAADTVRAAELFTMGDWARVTTKAGTDLSFRIGGWDRVAGVDNGTISTPGVAGNLPAGEALIVPIRGTGNGVVVADGSLSGGQGILKSPIRLFFEDGIVVRMEGNEQADAIETIFDNSGENSRNFAEFAIGLNEKAEIIGTMVMDEKLRGTAHVGIGNSECLGGDVYANSHIDALFLSPTIEIDGELIAMDGNLLLGDKKFEDYRNYSCQAQEGAPRLDPQTAAVVEGVLCRKWKDAWGKAYFTRVGVLETTGIVLAYFNALREGAIAAEDFGGQEEVNRLNRLLIRYGILSL